jgi:hypothetical protein
MGDGTIACLREQQQKNKKLAHSKEKLHHSSYMQTARLKVKGQEA